MLEVDAAHEVVRGFGAVGSYAARLLRGQGELLVGVADSREHSLAAVSRSLEFVQFTEPQWIERRRRSFAQCYSFQCAKFVIFACLKERNDLAMILSGGIVSRPPNRT